MTERATLLQAIVQVTLRMWNAASVIDHKMEAVYLNELTVLLGEYKSKFGDGR